MRSLALALLLACGACGGYFAPGGASLYCKDKQGKAIHCPNTPDTTRADTSRKEPDAK